MGNVTNSSHNFIKMNNGSDQNPKMVEVNEDNYDEAPDFNFSNCDLEKIQRGRNVL